MAAHTRDDVLYGKNHTDQHLDDGRWRHQESSSYARHARPRSKSPKIAEHGTHALADFFNQDRIVPPKSAGSGTATSTKSKPIMLAGNAPHSPGQTQYTNGEGNGDGREGHTFEVKCGPLLNYRRMERETWFGSVLMVMKGGGAGDRHKVPELRWAVKGTVDVVTTERSNRDAGNGMNGYHGTDGANDTNGVHGMNGVNGSHDTNGYHANGASKSHPMNGVDYTNSEHTPQNFSRKPQISALDGEDGQKDNFANEETKVRGTKLYSDPANTFWRFDLVVPMQDREIRCEYTIPGLTFPSEQKKRDLQHFYVPAITDSMRIMFHSCNGFSVGTDEESWSGAALWNDVMRVHERAPFHVMIGGGDQIYNDGIRVGGPLRQWTDISNPVKRREYPFPEKLRRECDEYYVNNYIRWYGTEPFATANGQIAQLNLWDDHDIIDGFGSYVDEFMRCAVFRGIGGCANKYYLLFQHHLAPPRSTFTTDAPQTTGHHVVEDDPRQLENTYVLSEPDIDSSYIIGAKPGPYVVEHSRSIYARLGARIGFFGIDARTERTRKQVNYPETYDIIFERLRKELSEAKSSSTPIKHLIVLLGIPIAYPRLTWLENIFSSPIIAPIKFLNKRFGFGGGFFNHFDGSVDLLDDLDDHYTAKTHKKERLFLVHQLQALAAEFSVRITMVSGDVHLAAVGRFYSSPKLDIAVSEDHRYMANIISSAIVNKPPPQAVANLLARRNKLHHLDTSTDETLMPFFDRDPGESSKTANHNKVTMPSRNWAMITENSNGVTQPASSTEANGVFTNGHSTNTPNGQFAAGNGEGGTSKIASGLSKATKDSKAKDGHSPLHGGEVDAGTIHKAAAVHTHGKGEDGSLDVAIRVEMDQSDKEGKTRSYGMTIPLLGYKGAADRVGRKRDNLRGAVNQGWEGRPGHGAGKEREMFSEGGGDGDRDIVREAEMRRKEGETRGREW